LADRVDERTEGSRITDPARHIAIAAAGAAGTPLRLSFNHIAVESAPAEQVTGVGDGGVGV
jgi:hypothetical protein